MQPAAAASGSVTTIRVLVLVDARREWLIPLVPFWQSFIDNDTLYFPVPSNVLERGLTSWYVVSSGMTSLLMATPWFCRRSAYLSLVALVMTLTS